ncbi:YhgE/Pip domain-containing protein [Clostridium sp. YIM B02505]|uniref:YhgE/Pip domain-containing protein n=1 Tax=Clostridium yunnanense TaxID=2800325 RepID=A0ABS1EP21_9CLOT|nr:YhgE/Pip domain-containing protein [Clostridium yunnanense]MBK1811126.1 YhgE/Pip domain-containing protein [Clostridium yunnanense]
MNGKSKTSSKKTLIIILSIALAAVMFIPMLYSSIYLGAFWDPYGRLDHVPVAFVNLDKSVAKDGKEYSVGKELENNLKNNDKVAWKFVSYEEAQKGVKGTDYYAMIEIPEDFSRKIADSQDGVFNTPEVIYEGNKGRNFVFSQISEKVAESIKSEVSSSIQKEISRALVDSLYEVKVSIKDAGDGATELQDGTQKLLDGSKTLADGLGTASNGSGQLRDGLMQASNGASTLENGTKQLLDGSNTLSSGLNQASNGSKDLKAGLTTLSNGETQVVDGAGKLVDGLNAFKQSLTAKNNQIPLLVDGATELSVRTNELKQKTVDFNYDNFNALATVVNGNESAIDTVNKVFNDELINNIKNSSLTDADKAKLKEIVGTIRQLDHVNKVANVGAHLSDTANKLKDFPQSINKLNQGAGSISTGINQLVSGLSETQSKAAVGADQLIAGAKAIQGGSSVLQAGLNTATEKTGELASGLNELSTGSTSLRDGLQSASSGTTSLKDGLNTAVVKTGELTDGLNKLSSGSVTLKNGLNDANDGAGKLKDGLNSGFDKMNGNLKFNSDNMSKFVSAPVTLKDNSINDIKYYGEGLAPYFVCLSLWLGSMFINLILSIAKKLNVTENKFIKSFGGKFAFGAAMATLQALILSFALVKGLNIDATSITSFYVSNIFIAIVFFSVMYGVSYAIGVIGTPIMFIIFLLQLSSSGGTFPIETAPTFYRVVGQIFPMTYAINTLRMIIGGVNTAILHKDIIILLAFMIAFLGCGYALRIILNMFKSNDNEDDAQELNAA